MEGVDSMEILKDREFVVDTLKHAAEDMLELAQSMKRGQEGTLSKREVELVRHAMSLHLVGVMEEMRNFCLLVDSRHFESNLEYLAKFIG